MTEKRKLNKLDINEALLVPQMELLADLKNQIDGEDIADGKTITVFMPREEKNLADLDPNVKLFTAWVASMCGETGEKALMKKVEDLLPDEGALGDLRHGHAERGEAQDVAIVFVLQCARPSCCQRRCRVLELLDVREGASHLSETDAWHEDVVQSVGALLHR